MSNNDLNGVQSKTETYAKLLLSEIALKYSKKSRLADQKKYLLVEGETDQLFIKKIVSPNTEIIVVSDRIRANNILKGHSPTTYSNSRVSSKDAIFRIMETRAHCANTIKWPKGSETLRLYGLIDKDFDPPEQYNAIPNLVVTFAHDLEMMLIATDRREIFTRIPGCQISMEDIKRAEYLAYQIALFRRTVLVYSKKNPGEYLSHGRLNDHRGMIRIESCCQSGSFCIDKAILYLLNEHQEIDESERSRILSALRRGLNQYWTGITGNFYIEEDAFDPYEIGDEDFWSLVNGHDYLASLIYYNADAYQAFFPVSTNGLNRKFEMTLIEAYDLSKIRQNDTYRNLKKHELVAYDK